MKKTLFIIIIILFSNQNLSALEKQMGKVEPEVVLACKEIIKGVESNDILFKKGFNKTEITGGTWLSHIHKWDSNTFTPAEDFLTSLDEKTYAWAEITGNPVKGSQFFVINILEIQDKDLSSDLNKRIILQEFFIKLLTPLEVSQDLIQSKKILLNSKSVTEFQNNILDHHMKLQKAQRYVYSNSIPQSKPYVSACYRE
jgi:hypothetical protein